MPYFLDGNNLIGRARGTSRPSEDDRRAFLAEVSERLRSTKARAVVFFDGGEPRRSSLGSLSVRDCGPEHADDVLVREIGRFRQPREVTVVTADRELARRSRDAGALTMAPEEFWARFGRRGISGQSGSPEKVNVEEWIRYFEDEKNRDS